MFLPWIKAGEQWKRFHEIIKPHFSHQLEAIWITKIRKRKIKAKLIERFDDSIRVTSGRHEGQSGYLLALLF